MRLNLPTDLLRTFVEVVETGSMMRASEQVFVTPSAISLQIKRLEEACQSALFFRDGRKLTLTPAGETLLGYARRILQTNDEAVDSLIGERAVGVVRIGMVEDFAQTLLVGTLRRFARLNFEVQVQLRVSGSQQLRELTAANRLDIALLMSAASTADTVSTRPVYWFGDEALVTRNVLPLALLEQPCLFREQALSQLTEAGIPYEIVVETGSVSALQAALEAGLGITPRVAMGVPGAQRIASLPRLPDVAINLITSFPASRAITNLRKSLEISLDNL